jgi:peptidoglycan/LPS O-acetylase OafA/YrhL
MPGIAAGPHDVAADPLPTPAGARRSLAYPAIEGLRGVLAIAVVVFHAGVFTGFTWGVDRTDHGIGGFLRHLDVAVPVFFAISGFLLYRPFVAACLGDAPRPATGPFLLRRFTRIYPAYWVALAVSVVVFGYAAGESAWALFRYAALIQIYWPDTATGGLAQAWSLDTEITFSLLLPVLGVLVAGWAGGRDRRADGRSLLLVVAALGLGGLAFRVWAVAAAPHEAIFWLPANLDMFAIGMVLAIVSVTDADRCGPGGPGPRRGPLRILVDAPGAAVMVVVAAFCALVALDLPVTTPPSAGQELLQRLLFAVVAVAVLVPAVFGAPRRSMFGRVLCSRALTWVGTVSLGVYVWHITVLYRLHRRFDTLTVGPLHLGAGLTLTLLGVLGSVAVGSLSWVLIERPLQRLARRVGRSDRS